MSTMKELNPKKRLWRNQNNKKYFIFNGFVNGGYLSWQCIC